MKSETIQPGKLESTQRIPENSSDLQEFMLAFYENRQEVYAFLGQFFEEQRVQVQAIDLTVVETMNLLAEFVLRGGKAVSPFLTKLAYEIGGGQNPSTILEIEGALELHHKYLLLLDDIVDRDQQRYGGPTLEQAYREKLIGEKNSEHRARSLAMIDGSLLISLSKQLLLQSDYPAEILLECLQIIHQHMSIEALAGWKIHYYQNTQSLAAANPDQFIKGLELVTARYKFMGPFEIGLALASNHNADIHNALARYASCVGTAFQVHDDILGLFGEIDTTGKPVGNDVREGKKTLLLQVAYQRADYSDRSFLESVVGQEISPDELERVREIIHRTGSLEYSKQLSSYYIEQGIAALNILPDSRQKQHLIALAHFIISREK